METKSIARAISKGFAGAKKKRDVWMFALAAVVSVAGSLVLWCTNAYRDAILSNLELRNDTPSFRMWQRPPVSLDMKVYVFNYTNLREFESGEASKLRVEEVGPYVYRETLSRVNAKMHENGTVSYQEKRSFRWISGRTEEDAVIVPNIPLMSTVAFSRDMQFLAQLGLTIFLSGLKAKPFLRLSVGEYLWGYEDSLYEMIRPFASLKHPLPHGRFGILVFKNGVNPDRITMHTGADDLRNLGLIQRVNGMDDRKVWGDEKCDRVYGTDGSIFPPHWIDRPNSTIYVYAKDVCRQIPFRFEGRGFANGIPTLRYKIPGNVFTSTPDKDPCFCSNESDDSISRRCPPAGTLNISACKYGAPMLVSFPHFYSGDESLFQSIDGLSPRRERHECYIDLHQRLGITVDTRMRLQLNLEVRKATGVPFSGKLKDGTILPLIWLDLGVGDLPESVQRIFYRSHYLVNAVEAGLQWCSLVGAILSVTGLLAACTRDKRTEDKCDARSNGSAVPIELARP